MISQDALELAKAFLRAEEGGDDYSADDLIDIGRALAKVILADAGESLDGTQE